MPEHDQLRATFFFWLAASAVAGLVIAGVWRVVPGLRRLLNARPDPPMGWGALVVYVGCVAFFFLPALVVSLAAGGATTSEGAGRSALRQLGITLASGPLLLVAVLVTAWFDTRTPPHQLLGLGRGRWMADVGLGLLTGFAVTAFVNLFNAALGWWLATAFDMDPEEHPLVILARQGLSPLEWAVLIGAVVLAAPLKEEVLFRGLLQRWFALYAWGGDLAMVAALAVSIIFRFERIQSAWSGGGAALVGELATTIFVIAMALPYLFLRARRELAAWYGTSLLFGAIHAGVWPTPVPLFLFGLVLGELTRRTGSVVPPLAAHAFFNAAACAVLAGTR